MSSELREISLKDAVEFIVDNRGKTAPTVENGIALIATNCVNNKDLYPQKLNLRYVSQDTYENWFRAHPKAGDILLTNKGSQNGAICLVPDPVDFCIAQDMVALRADPEKIHPLYLFAALRSEVVQQRIKALNVDAVIPHLKKTDFDKLLIPLPDAATQKWIGEWYFQLSSRIELLRETNTTLEAIAQALFKSWFVDFDPVHAKMQGRAPEGMDQATAALFPDSFEDSELGPVPKGWSIACVADVAEIVKGKSYSSKDLVDQHTTALVTLKSFERGGGFRMDGFKPYSGAFKPSQVVTSGDLIVAYTDVTQAAELIGKPAIVVGIEEHDTLVASLDVGIVRPDFSKCGRQFLYGLFKTDSFQSHTLAHTSGTTVLHLSKDGVGSYRFALPTFTVNSVFEEIASDLAKRRQTNSDQIRTLSALRDTLLPRLIYGQLQLADAHSVLAG